MIDRADLFDHVAKANGQVVNCERAAFVAVAFPAGFYDRVRLGFELGVGLAFGGITVACAVSMASKLVGGLL